MKALIPAKASSTRVPEKNFHPFQGGRFLIETLIDKLARVLPRREIYVSCEDESKRPLIERTGAQFLPRDPRLASNETPIGQVVTKLCRQLPGRDEIAFCHPTEPLFDEYAECMATWERVKHEHDSLVIAYPHRRFFLQHDFTPYNFQFGPWHR